MTVPISPGWIRLKKPSGTIDSKLVIPPVVCNPKITIAVSPAIITNICTKSVRKTAQSPPNTLYKHTTMQNTKIPVNILHPNTKEISAAPPTIWPAVNAISAMTVATAVKILHFSSNLILNHSGSVFAFTARLSCFAPIAPNTINVNMFPIIHQPPEYPIEYESATYPIMELAPICVVKRQGAK